MASVDVAIVGGGASGALVAAQLLRGAQPGFTIALVERSGRLARGLAYGPAESVHLLNLSAARMSALPEDPDHFVRWAGIAGSSFAGRAAYGSYLDAVFAEAVRRGPGALASIDAEVVGASLSADGVRLELRDGRSVEARVAVLALGNLPSGDLPVADGGLYASERYRSSPWTPGALDDIEPEAAVLLVGTGLTMIDAAMALRLRGHRGAIHALSRHGLLPRPHAAPRPCRSRIGAIGVRGLLRAVRDAAARDGDWRGVLDAMRASTRRLWTRLPLAEKRRFLRHLRPFWEVHRHRMAPQVAAAVDRMRGRGQLLVHAGRIAGFALEPGGAVVRFRPRGAANLAGMLVERVVSCTGPATDFGALRHPLIASLLKRGLARPDAVGIGFATDEDGALSGEAGGRLFTLGSLRRGEIWETTALPEIREQAAALAARVVRELRDASRLAQASN